MWEVVAVSFAVCWRHLWDDGNQYILRGRLDGVRPDEPPSDINIELDVIGDIDQMALVLGLGLMLHVDLLVCWIVQV